MPPRQHLYCFFERVEGLEEINVKDLISCGINSIIIFFIWVLKNLRDETACSQIGN